MNYREIYKPLSRTSFASKMYYAFSSSINTMSTTGQVERDDLRTKFLPDEIETFVMNCISTKEYSYRDMTDKQFIDVMNAIRSFQPPEHYERLKTEGLKWVLPTIGAVQFESQQYSIFRLYRHSCLFSFVNKVVDVSKEFKKKFDRSFDEYAAIVFSFHMLLAEKEIKAFSDYWNKILVHEPWFVKNLKLTRDQYKEELKQFARSTEDYKYCLRPSYSYPFIEFEDAIFLPTPHLLIQSITTAMMNRLTYEDLALREKIGKNACEEYLLNIVSNSKLFDEVKKEYEYASGQKTLDILARKGSIALLIDSKLFSPKVGLRTYDDQAYRKDVDRIVKDMKQGYLHAHDKFGHDYNPFSSTIDDVYALIVIYQEGYIDLGEVYTKTAHDLSIEMGSAEYDWLWHHIGLTDVATIERFLLTKTDIIPEIMSRSQIADNWLTGWNGSDLTDEVLRYQDKLTDDVEKLANKLYR